MHYILNWKRSDKFLISIFNPWSTITVIIHHHFSPFIFHHFLWFPLKLWLLINSFNFMLVIPHNLTINNLLCLQILYRIIYFRLFFLFISFLDLCHNLNCLVHLRCPTYDPLIHWDISIPIFILTNSRIIIYLKLIYVYVY